MTESARWPYTEPHIAFYRYGVRVGGTLLKGLTEGDVELVAEDDPSCVVMVQAVVFVTAGPDEGYEVLGPWRTHRRVGG